MVKVRDGFYRQLASTIGSDSYLLKSGGDISDYILVVTTKRIK